MKIVATILKLMSYKCLFGVDVKRRYKFPQVDVVKVFLYGFLDKIIYVEQPHFFEYNFKLIYRLHKAPYRLKQAPQVWYQTLADFLQKIGLDQFELDYSVFVSQDY